MNRPTGRTAAHLTEAAIAGTLIAIAGTVVEVDRALRRSMRARKARRWAVVLTLLNLRHVISTITLDE